MKCVVDLRRVTVIAATSLHSHTQLSGRLRELARPPSHRFAEADARAESRMNKRAVIGRERKRGPREQQRQWSGGMAHTNTRWRNRSLASGSPATPSRSLPGAGGGEERQGECTEWVWQHRGGERRRESDYASDSSAVRAARSLASSSTSPRLLVSISGGSSSKPRKRNTRAGGHRPPLRGASGSASSRPAGGCLAMRSKRQA